jgi:hypothetical protein
MHLGVQCGFPRHGRFLLLIIRDGQNHLRFVLVIATIVRRRHCVAFVPVDAKIARDAEVPIEVVRISDFMRPLASLNLKASVVVLDVARATSRNGC